MDSSSLFLGDIPLPSATIAVELIFLVILLVLSGLISASEVAFFSLSDKILNDFKESKISVEKQIFDVMHNQRKNLLATVLILNNTVNVGIVMLSTYITWQIFGKDEGGIIILVLTASTTAAIVFFGELLPKAIAQRRNVPIAKFLCGPIMLGITLVKPIAWFLINFSDLIEKAFKGNKTEEPISLEKINEVLDLTTSGDTQSNKKMLKGIINFGQKNVRQIMRSRLDMCVVSVDTNFTSLLEIIRENGYSRIPVYEGNIDKIVGILYAKDFLGLRNVNHENFSWRQFVRDKILFVPETKKVDDLFHLFQDKRVHMAIVIDEYGGTSGLVTLEDVIEEIVGDINDEFDDEEELLFMRIDTKTLRFAAKIGLSELCEALQVSEHYFDEVKGESETLSGLILELCSYMPKNGDVINFKNFSFEIEEANSTRLMYVIVRTV